MLTVLDLNTIDQIFTTEATDKLKAASKMLYINCLMHHFRDKQPTFSDSHSFELTYSEAQYEKFKARYDDLKASGLITYHDHFIRFENKWNEYIDHNRFDRQLDNNINSAEDYRNILKQKENGLSIVGSRNRLPIEKVKQLVDIFIDEQAAVDKTYKDENDCFKHFMYWTQNNKQLVTSSSASSTAKILGEQ